VGGEPPWACYPEGREPVQGERPCQFPGCGDIFAPPNPRSTSKYCPKHPGGRVRANPPEPQPDLSAEQLERLSGFLRERVPLLPIPPKIFATRIEDMGFDTPQEGVALFSDLHYYSQIDRRVTGICEYNIDIARDRMARWRDGLLRFTQMNQLWVPLDTLHIFALGDELEGHGRMFPTQALQMSESLLFQVMGFVEDMTDVLLSFLARYKKVIIYKVVGNHGRTAERARDSYGPDNAELFAWEIIAERVRGACGGTWQETTDGVHALTGGSIDFHLHRSFLAKVDILGWRCVGRHGHGIRGLDSTYVGALDNKLRLNSVLGEIIHYYFKGHLHERQSAESEIGGEVIQNGSFVGPSLLTLERSRAAATLPSQEFMLFHPRYGKTHQHTIHLATAEEVRQVRWIGEEKE